MIIREVEDKVVNKYEENDELRSNGEVLIKLDTLETLRRTWFDMGYDVGYKDGRNNRKKDVDKRYREIRRPMGEK